MMKLQLNHIFIVLLLILGSCTESSKFFSGDKGGENLDIVNPVTGDELGDNSNTGGNPNNPSQPGSQPGDEPGDQPGDEPGDQPGDEPGDQPGDEPGDLPTSFLFKGRSLNPKEIQVLDMPYRRWLTNIVAPGEDLTFDYPRRCRFNRGKCVVNHQVGFSFDLDTDKHFQKALSLGVKIKKFSLKLESNTIVKNKGTEILCQLNLRVCSGVSVDKGKKLSLARIDLNPRFWEKDFTRLRNNKFSEIIKDNNLQFVGSLELSDTLELSSDEVETLVNSPAIQFVIAEDTFVQNLKLYIEVEY